MNNDGKQQLSLFAAKTISSIVFILFLLVKLIYRREGDDFLAGAHWPTKQLPLSSCPAVITWTRVLFFSFFLLFAFNLIKRRSTIYVCLLPGYSLIVQYYYTLLYIQLNKLAHLLCSRHCLSRLIILWT